MAEDEAHVLASAKKLPLSNRFEHKNWKVRSEAYDDVRSSCKRAFSSSDPIIDEAGPLFAKSVGDANANAIDRALDALCAWLQKADESQASRIVGPVCSTMASKCLKARPGTVAKATEASLLFIELEQQIAVVEATLKALHDKVPKVVLAALEILYRAVSEFGIPKVIDPKPIFKELPMVYSHPNAAVRDKAKELSIELATWVGLPAVQGVLLDKMVDAMRKEVEAGILKIHAIGKRKPTRYTHKEAAKRAAENDDDAGDVTPMEVDDYENMNGDEGGGLTTGASDPYDLATPVDIFTPLSKTTIVVGDVSTPFWDCFDSKKWNVRKAALDKVKEVTKLNPRLSAGDGSLLADLCRQIRKILTKDANINCASAAADVTMALARGLRQDFSSYARQLAGPLLERFKEKNSSMSTSAYQSLRTMATYCYSLQDVSDDIVSALGHKNPKVRLDTLRLLKDVVSSTCDVQSIGKSKVDSLLIATATLAPDADANIRENAQAVLVAFAQKLGSFSAIRPFLLKLEESRGKMIEEAIKGAMVVAVQKERKPLQKEVVITSNEVVVNRVASPVPSHFSSLPAHRQQVKPAKPTNATNAAKPIMRQKLSAHEDDVAPIMTTTSGRFSPEEAEDHLTNIFGTGVVQGLRSPQWQTRVESMTIISEYARNNAGQPDTSSLLLCLSHIPGWGDKNFQVINKCLEIATILGANCPGYTKVHACIAVEGSCDKIHELKHRLPACDALTAAAEAVGPRFVFLQLQNRAASNKNPKVLSESLTWMATAVEEFGLAALDTTALLEWLTTNLTSPNAPVRNQTMNILGRCHAQIGGGLLDRLSGSLKPALVTALEEIFRKNPHNAGYQPTRHMRNSEKSDRLEACVNKELLPRVSIANSLSSSGVVALLASSNWKERNAAMEEIEEIIKRGGRVQPDLPSELFSNLRGRMTDTNRNLAARALLLLGKLAKAVGPPFDKMARQVLIPAISTLSDNKKTVRDAVIALLDAWVTTCPAEKVLGPLADLIAHNPKVGADGRTAALGWMTQVMATDSETIVAAKCAEPALRAAVAALGDKAANVRDSAGQLIIQTASVVPQDELAHAVNALDSNGRKLVEPWLLKAGESVSTTGDGADRNQAVKGSTTTATPAPKQSSIAVSVPVVNDAHSAPLLSMSSAKAARARLFCVRIGRFEGPSTDELDAIEVAFGGIASEELKSLLFSKEFKDHVKAADTLSKASSLMPEVISCLDIIFRWSIYRICENNPQVLLSVLDMLRTILMGLASQGYQLTDVEAMVLLPGLVEKSGHNQERVRGLLKEVLRATCAVYPTVKIIDHLTQGLSGSKNNRTRIECCEMLNYIAQNEQGIDGLTASKSKTLPALASALKDGDGGLRNAVLTVIETVWIQVQRNDQTLYTMLGALEGRQKDMIEDRLKRSVAQSQSRIKEDEDDEMGNNGSFLTPPDTLDVTPIKDNGKVTTTTTTISSTPLPSIISMMPNNNSADQSMALPATGPGDADFEQRWTECLALMASPNLSIAINATKQLCSEIMIVTDRGAAPPASRQIRVVMGSSAERLFTAVLAQLNAIFAQEAEDNRSTLSSRGCKFALNVMLQSLNVEEVARGLSQGTLRRAISLLLCQLVEERGLLIFEEGATLVRAVNVLIAKMLESVDRNYSFAALLQLLREAPSGLPTVSVPKFNDLVVKCLIKLTKGLQINMEGVDLSALLLNIHDFFLYLGVDEIRRRSAVDDKPLRMVKTLLHELCKMCGHNIYVYAAGIPGRKEETKPIIFAYIELNLASLEHSGLIPAATGEEEQLAEMKRQEAEMVAAKAAVIASNNVDEDIQEAARKAEIKSRLKSVMTRLVQHDVAQQKTAIMELYRLQREAPDLVDRYIAGTSIMFREFISKALKELEEDGARTTTAAGYLASQSMLPTPGSSGTRLSSLRERLSNIKSVANDASQQGNGGAGHLMQNTSNSYSVEALAARLEKLRR